MKENRLNRAKGMLASFEKIQGEISEMESSTTVFMIRMGSNIQASIDVGDGVTTYNKETKQVDINIGKASLFSTMQSLSLQITPKKRKKGYEYLE